jgi:hypothetical protein
LGYTLESNNIYYRTTILNIRAACQPTLSNTNKALPITNFDKPQNKLVIINLTPQDVEDALKSPDIHKVTGLDEVSNHILRIYSMETENSTIFSFHFFSSM